MRRVYVVIPMYNARNKIDLAVRSVLSQKDVDVRLVLVDHGSKDDTCAYVKAQYGNLDNVEVIGLTRIPNEIRSASRPLNNGMKYVASHADGPAWVMRLDSDDVLANDSVLSNMFANYRSGAKMICGSMLFIDVKRKTSQEYRQAPRYNSAKELMEGAAYAYPHHSTLVSVSLLKKILADDGYCYFEKIGYGEDLDYTLRLLSNCDESEICFADEPMIIKELSGDTITNSIGTKTLIHDHYMIFKRNRSMSRILFFKIILWFLIDGMGKFGRSINSRRTPPAEHYSVSNILEYEKVYAMKAQWS